MPIHNDAYLHRGRVDASRRRISRGISIWPAWFPEASISTNDDGSSLHASCIDMEAKIIFPFSLLPLDFFLYLTSPLRSSSPSSVILHKPRNLCLKPPLVSSISTNDGEFALHGSRILRCIDLYCISNRLFRKFCRFWNWFSILINLSIFCRSCSLASLRLIS